MANPAKEGVKASSTGRSALRRVAVGLLVAISALSLSAYVVVRWAERQVLQTDSWVAMVGPLPKQPVVSTALGNFIGDKVFAAAPVERQISAALPPRAGFLAGPLASQLHDITNRLARKVVASDGFQAVWIASNRIAMGRLLATARGQPTMLQSKLDQKFNLNISDVSGQLEAALGKASAAIPALQPGARTAVGVSVNLHAKGDKIRQIIRAIDNLSVILPLVVIAGFLSALAVSHQRRKTTLAAMIVLVILMLVELILVKALRQQVLGQVNNPANLSAVGYIYDTLAGSLKSMMFAVAGAAVVVWAGCLAAGPAAWAKTARSYIRVDRLKDNRVTQLWREFRQRAAAWQGYLWIASVLVVAGAMAVFVPVVDGRSIINGLLILLSLVAIIRILATPPIRRSTAQQAARR